MTSNEIVQYLESVREQFSPFGVYFYTSKHKDGQWKLHVKMLPADAVYSLDSADLDRMDKPGVAAIVNVLMAKIIGELPDAFDKGREVANSLDEHLKAKGVVAS